MPIGLLSVPSSAVMSSKFYSKVNPRHADGTLERDNDNDDGDFRRVITVHRGFHAVQMSKTPKRERLRD